MEMMPGIIISGIFATFIFSLIPIFVLRRLWKGRRWAYFLTLFGSAFAVFVGALSLQSFISADYFSRLADESLTSRPRDYVVSIVVSDIMGAFLTAFYLVIVVLLLSRSTRSYVAAARLTRLKAREQVNADDGWVVFHQDAETCAHLDEEQTRRKRRKLTDGLKKRPRSSTRRPAARMHGGTPAASNAAIRILPCTPRKATASIRVGCPSSWGDSSAPAPRYSVRGAKKRKKQRCQNAPQSNR